MASRTPCCGAPLLRGVCEELAGKHMIFRATFVGDSLEDDGMYYDALRERANKGALVERITFLSGVPNTQTPRIYSAHSIFVNLSASGMYDKTLFEAAACECLVLASSRDFAERVDTRFVFAEGDARDLASKLQALLSIPASDHALWGRKLRSLAEQDNLRSLANHLAEEMA